MPPTEPDRVDVEAVAHCHSLTYFGDSIATADEKEDLCLFVKFVGVSDSRNAVVFFWYVYGYVVNNRFSSEFLLCAHSCGPSDVANKKDYFTLSTFFTIKINHQIKHLKKN